VINRNKINKTILNRNSQLLEVLNKIDKKSQSNFNYLCNLSIKKMIGMNKVIFYGNGGSAADSQHLSTELVVKFKKKKKSFTIYSIDHRCFNNFCYRKRLQI